VSVEAVKCLGAESVQVDQGGGGLKSLREEERGLAMKWWREVWFGPPMVKVRKG
jgi:hypothetical protein